MDYPEGSVIEFKPLNNNNVLIFRSKGTAYQLSALQRSEPAGSAPCPTCGSEDTRHYCGMSASYCHTCGQLWVVESMFCLACGRFVRYNGGKLYCDWCGQVWDYDVIKEAYLNNDEWSMCEVSTPKGANKSG